MIQQKLYKALHIEGHSDRAHGVRTKLSKWYSSAFKFFPDCSKLRLIPPFNTTLSTKNRLKFATLITRQKALNRRLACTTPREFATNILLDKPESSSGKSLRQVLIEIQSTVYPGTSVFYTINKSWRVDNAVTFTFVLENKGHMFVSGFMPYLRLINPSHLLVFTEDARYHH